MNPQDDFTVGIMKAAEQIERKHKAEKVKAVAAAATETAAAAEPYSTNDELRQDGFPYTPEAMVQLLIDNPSWSHRQYAKHFGRTTGWFASVLASDLFQQSLDLRRHEVADPSLTATLEERFRALTLRSLDVLQVMLDNPKVLDATALKAAEIGIKALGLGMKKNDDDDLKPKEDFSLDTLANRLTTLLASKGKGQGMIEHRTTQQQHAAKMLDPTDVLLMELKEIPDAKADS